MVHPNVFDIVFVICWGLNVARLVGNGRAGLARGEAGGSRPAPHDQQQRRTTAEARGRQAGPTTDGSSSRQAEEAHDQQQRRTTDRRSQRQTAERPFVSDSFNSAAVCASRPREDTFGLAQTPERKREEPCPRSITVVAPPGCTWTHWGLNPGPPAC